MSAVTEMLDNSPLIAILRASTSNHLLAAATVLVSEGVSTLEFPLTTPGALDAITAARQVLGDRAAIGAGTVLTAADAAAAVGAGAQFVVSPAVCSAATREAGKLGIPTIPGAMTPTEVLQCVEDGAYMVKLFPAATLGPAFIKHITAPLPGIRFVATGGVGRKTAEEFLDAGASALGVGSPITGEFLESGNMGELRRLAQAWRPVLTCHSNAIET